MDQTKQKNKTNTVYIGKKPTMAYVLACITQLSEGNSEITIRARGRTISQAVDVAEVVRNKFVKDASVKNIVIGTEELESKDGQMLNVSSIEIVLGRK
ncbi:MAG: DNA-binding protein Alba [Candidatus Aenigmarchaeota archaeon]|nr:DNA-binding protein Alba [Candidatus Aenigmarchaeota archaeon]